MFPTINTPNGPISIAEVAIGTPYNLRASYTRAQIAALATALETWQDGECRVTLMLLDSPVKSDLSITGTDLPSVQTSDGEDVKTVKTTDEVWKGLVVAPEGRYVVTDGQTTLLALALRVSLNLPVPDNITVTLTTDEGHAFTRDAAQRAVEKHTTVDYLTRAIAWHEKTGSVKQSELGKALAFGPGERTALQNLHARMLYAIAFKKAPESVYENCKGYSYKDISKAVEDKSALSKKEPAKNAKDAIESVKIKAPQAFELVQALKDGDGQKASVLSDRLNKGAALLRIVEGSDPKAWKDRITRLMAGEGLETIMA